ncbi:glucose-6-phosphate 1-dehydrogenase, partial [Musa troglodytarum]
VASKCFFHCAASGTTTRVCELKIWMLERLKWQKNIRTHGWEKKPRMLQVQDSVEETTSNSEVAESSPPNVQPIIPKVLECSTESSSSSASGNSVDRAPSLGEHEANRIFYLSVPQEALLDVSVSLADNSQTKRGWNRIIIEKPFGFDALSSYKLTQCFLSKFQEKQLYRIDHRLGKDLIENITVLRFSNLVILSEECGMEAQGRYFGHYGVIRDIVHSHILQTIALFAMEPPVSLDGEDIRNEKVKVLRSIRKLNLNDVVLGQYKNSADKSGCYMNSLMPTFFAAALYIDNARWDGVPFLVKTGVGLIKHRQPDEAILLKVNNKVPGLGLQLDASELNLLYRDKYDVEVPDSYEHLLLDVIDGDTHLFMRSDELEAAWNILTPILDKIEENKVVPELYETGGRGPVGAYYLGAKHGNAFSSGINFEVILELTKFESSSPNLVLAVSLMNASRIEDDSSSSR